jgi:hypothetical protein
MRSKGYGIETRWTMAHQHKYESNRYCGAQVCVACDDHKGLARCYCGWAESTGGDGRQELIEMGETIDPEE